MAGADDRVAAVFCVFCGTGYKVHVELLSLAAKWGGAGYTEGLHISADL